MQSQDKASTSIIYRALISGILHFIDDKCLGNFNGDLLQDKYTEIIEACKGNIKIINPKTYNYLI